jgi:hypothetical protein
MAGSRGGAFALKPALFGYRTPAADDGGVRNRLSGNPCRRAGYEHSVRTVTVAIARSGRGEASK